MHTLWYHGTVSGVAGPVLTAVNMLEAWVAQNCAGADVAAGASPRPAAPVTQGAVEGAARPNGGHGEGPGPAPVPQWVEALLLVLDVLLQERPRERGAVPPAPGQVRCAPYCSMRLRAHYPGPPLN